MGRPGTCLSPARMFVRSLIPLALSTCLLVFGPSAKGDLAITPPDVEVPELAPEQSRAAVPAPETQELAHALLASRLEVLDRGIPGLAVE